MSRTIQFVADKALQRIVPQVSARADDCSYEQRCAASPRCVWDNFRKTQEREVCAGWSGPGYGPWYDIGCGC